MPGHVVAAAGADVLQGHGSRRANARLRQAADQKVEDGVQGVGVLLDPLTQLAQQQDGGVFHGYVGVLRHVQDGLHHFRDHLVLRTGKEFGRG